MKGNASNNQNFPSASNRRAYHVLHHWRKIRLCTPLGWRKTPQVGWGRNAVPPVVCRSLATNSFKRVYWQCLGCLSTTNHPVSPINLSPHLLSSFPAASLLQQQADGLKTAEPKGSDNQPKTEWPWHQHKFSLVRQTATCHFSSSEDDIRFCKTGILFSALSTSETCLNMLGNDVTLVVMIGYFVLLEIQKIESIYRKMNAAK